MNKYCVVVFLGLTAIAYGKPTTSHLQYRKEARNPSIYNVFADLEKTMNQHLERIREDLDGKIVKAYSILTENLQKKGKRKRSILDSISGSRDFGSQAGSDGIQQHLKRLRQLQRLENLRRRMRRLHLPTAIEIALPILHRNINIYATQSRR